MTKVGNHRLGLIIILKIYIYIFKKKRNVSFVEMDEV